jgi:hypothetical protein
MKTANTPSSFILIIIFFNKPLNIAMCDIQTSEVDTKLAPVNVGPYNFYDDRSLVEEQLLIR